MARFVACLALAGCLLALDLSAAETPGPGKLLVASRQLQGPAFAEAVILLIHYDATGAMGLIVNRPTSLVPAEALPRLPALADYRGPMYLGGPVERRRVLALVRAEQPPATAATIIDGVHFAPLNGELLADTTMDASRLRLYVGYAGWGPGQLDAELARGSWHVMAASDELVFSDEVDDVWRRLIPAPRYQVSTELPGLAGT
ncbi:MAG: YqgE/AlgH family protein [Chromatiales bacterium]|nr:MAG: YqgE/AlgH family protein [Chromatiales bacterium]